MKPFEEALEAASASEAIAGAVLVASDKTGKFTYTRASGKRSVRPGADQSPLTPTSIMWIASCTKVITSLAALQCVERGLLSLDEPIYDILPEFRGMMVLKRFNADGSPVLEEHSTPITLRLLLNHSSGLAYDETHPKLMAWHAWHRTSPNRANVVEARFGFPLVFEPGSSWCYGAGVDWAGVAVERVTGISLQRYFEENVFSRVGARDVVFSSYLHQRPDLQARIVDMSKRDPKNPERVFRSNARAQWNERGGCFGGLGLFASPVDYVRIIRGLLGSGEEKGRLLKPESLEEFFRPCLSKGAKRALNKTLEVEENRVGMGNLPRNVTKNWALGGIVNEEDVPGGRRAGTMTWTGLPNLTWFADRTTGLCGLYAGQLYPPGDAKVGELFAKFEQGIYEMYSQVPSRL